MLRLPALGRKPLWAYPVVPCIIVYGEICVERRILGRQRSIGAAEVDEAAGIDGDVSTMRKMLPAGPGRRGGNRSSIDQDTYRSNIKIDHHTLLFSSNWIQEHGSVSSPFWLRQVLSMPKAAP